MITRRRILAATAGAVVVGAGGIVELGSARRDRILHRLGLASSPDRHVPASNVTVQSGSFSSRRMAAPVGWAIAHPSTPARGVIICLQGKSNDHRFAFDEIHLQDVVAAAHAPLAVAAVDGGPDSYWHPRADGTDALGMLLEEFVPLVDQHLGSALPRAALGWSMGGYGALLAAEQLPAQFRVVAAASPALWTTPGATAPGAFDSPADYHRFDVFASVVRLDPVAVRVDCGTGDPFYAAARKFVSRLPRGATTSFGPGFHDSAYWRSVAPAQIATIAAALVP